MLSFCLPAILASFLISSIPQSLASSISKVEALNERDDWNVLVRTFDLDNTKDARNVVIDELKNVVYVGAVDYLYALDLDNIETIKKKMHWGADEKSFEMCDLFEPNPELCRNAIRILHSVNDTHLYACGTNALEPRCIYVNKQTFRQEGNSISGSSKSPADPFSVTVSTMTGGSLFTAINPNSQSKNGMIAKSPANSEQGVLTTNELDNFWLSDPRFVSMFTVPEVYSEEQKIVVLFKENAEEIPLEILTQDSDYSVNLVYSRLATICANDRGGREWFSLDKQLATFSKMRIACPVSIESPGKSRAMPFFYDEIQSTYIIPNPQEPDNPSIYAIFKTPKGPHQATATCVYTMRDIQQYMNTYKYWNKPGTDSSSALFSMYTNSDYPAPGSCGGDTTQFSKDRANYGSEHPLKFGIIKPKDGFAIYQDSGVAYSHIIVDRIQRKEKIPDGMSSLLVEKEYDVVHYITETGFIKRVVFSVDDRSVHWEIPSRNLFNDSDTKDSVLSVKKGDNGFIYFGTTSSVLQLRIASCSAYSTCGECRLSNDPYCEWDGDLDIACKEIDFSTKIHKKPLTLITRQNETGCGISDSSDHKKQESTSNEVATGGIELKKQNEALINQTRALNQTILKLEKEKRELKSELAANVVELYNWYNNYTQLSSLLLQYNQRLKLISQLYRDTAYALNKCQDEKSSKNILLKNANVQLKAHKTASSKCKKEKRAAEQAPCKCTQTSGTTSSARGASSRTLRVPVSKSLAVDRNAPSSACQSRVDKLQSQVVAFLQTKHNMTKKIKQLNRTIDNLKAENAKIVASTTGKKECTTRDQWISYLPTNKHFLITQASVTFAKAQQDCALLGGSVADLKDDGEARFIFNITHSLYPRKRYWVGLRKYADGVKWLDGSAFDETVTPRFARSQNARLKSRIQYCVETLHRVGIWQLLPCSRHRRVICVKR